jgi:integrase/recombinase XerC
MTSTEHVKESGSVSAAELEAARMLLVRMGITPEDLLRAAAPARAAAPTFAEYVDTLLEAIPDKRG